MNNKQSGFTLVEIAIVLVIIGLLLGGVLKGQELINSAKVKNYATDFRNIPLLIYGYQDKFRALPGDDPTADTRFTGGTKATNGTLGNGVIQGNWNSETMLDETVLFWQHVRLANLAAGSTDFASLANASLPANADGGRIGIQSGTAPLTGLAGSYFICSAGIQGKYAKQLDVTMDDGDTAKGSMRAGTGTAPGTAITAAPLSGTGAIVDGNTYTVCLGF